MIETYLFGFLGLDIGIYLGIGAWDFFYFAVGSVVKRILINQ
jgi:hypothetical protein